ncbi:MAG: hypothetical protein K5989_09330 [Lachnospiraceae bacterium]|nr:hypothetical protein [Lachnospiraceae bacterium]
MEKRLGFSSDTEVRKQSVVSKRISYTSIALTVLVMIAFIITLIVVGRAQQANDDKYALTQNANRFLNGSKTLTNEVRAYASTTEEEHYNNYWKEINDDKNRDIGVANMKEIGISDEEEQTIEKMSALSNQLVPWKKPPWRTPGTATRLRPLNMYTEENIQQRWQR